jgi:O-antigen/teichoic acid export membrane protein
LETRVRVAAAATSLLALVAATSLLVAGAIAVPRLFQGGFQDAVPTAAILLVGTIATALGGPCGLLLNLTGHGRWTATASTISLAFAAATMIPAAHMSGSIGAATVLAAATTLRVGLMARFALRQAGIRTTASFSALYHAVYRTAGR